MLEEAEQFAKGHLSLMLLDAVLFLVPAGDTMIMS